MKKILKIKKREERRILGGHLWVFSNEVAEIQGAPQAGDVVELRKYSGEFIGKGFYNPNSLILFRLLTTLEEEIDFQFFNKRIENALTLRKKIFPDSGSFRLVNGESDYLPGLIIDKYNDFLVIQTYSFGMDRRLNLICDVLESLFSPKGIVQRDESQLRELEGLTPKKGILRGNAKKTIISENGIYYEIDILEGQKTGLFLDQRENRRLIQRYVKDKNVLDCFCNDGGFSLNSALAGASSVVGLDISESAILRAINNLKLNKLTEKVKFIKSDVFEYLKETVNKGEKFDVVILDPPSFTKSRKNVTTAKKGYIEINSNAIRALNENGILATASCSHHIDESTFLEIINKSARAANKEIRLLEWHGASPDHPVIPAMPETKYLKFGIFIVT